MIPMDTRSNAGSTKSNKSYLSRDKLAFMNRDFQNKAGNESQIESRIGDGQGKSQVGSEAVRSKLSDIKPISIAASGAPKLDQIDELIIEDDNLQAPLAELSK